MGLACAADLPPNPEMGLASATDLSIPEAGLACARGLSLRVGIACATDLFPIPEAGLACATDLSVRVGLACAADLSLKWV